MEKAKSIRAVIYARTSGDDNDLESLKAKKEGRKSKRRAQSESIAEQIKACEERSKKLGHDLIGTFQDPGVSGRTYPTGYEIPDLAFEDYFNAHIKRAGKRSRNDLGKLLDTKHIDVIIVRDIYRLLRPAFQSHLGNHLWQILTRRKIKIHSISDGDIDSSKFEDLMITNLKLQIADQAKRSEVEASIRSLRKKKDDGELASGVKCFGFRSRKGEVQQVDPVPDELRIVRLIFDRFLGGMNMSEIARRLNDIDHVHTIRGKRWTVHQIRKVLLRPWYAGMMLNTRGELIESKVFPIGNKAIVKPDEFYRVMAQFDKRKKFEVRTERDAEREAKQANEGKPNRGGSKLGVRHDRGPIHPFTGLLKCCCCGRHLYAMPIKNTYYSEKIVVRSVHYVCKTPFYTEDPKFDECSRVRIKELYPQKSLELGIKPNGYGLIEALFPLLFQGYVRRYIQQTSNLSHLLDIKSQLDSQLSRIKEHELELFDQQENGAVDKEQFDIGMARNRERKTEIRNRLNGIEQEIAALDTGKASVPHDIYTDPDKVPLEELQILAHETFREIIVYPDRIRVVLRQVDEATKKHHEFEIGRIRTRNSRDLPFYKGRISGPEITAKTRIGVMYFNKSTQLGVYLPVRILYQDPTMEVLSVGLNTSIDKKRAEAFPEPTDGDKWLEEMLGPVPSYQRKLETNSEAFFTASPLNRPPKKIKPVVFQ